MRHMITITLLAVLLAPVGARADQAAFTVMATASPTAEAPAAWNQQDPADSLYRAAREALTRGDYEDAAELFRRVWNEHPRSTYAPDALYWEAFNRYRMEDTDHLRRALELLELQAERYAEASTRRNGDARALQTRIRGLLARQGDAQAAEAIVVAANEVARMGVGIGEAVAAEVAMAAEEIAASSDVIAEQARAAAMRGVAMAEGIGYTRTSQLPQECREQTETQLAAMNALIHMNADRAIPVLRQVMERRDECSVVLRRRAIFLIADKQTDETVDILLDAANNDPDVEVRRQAVFWLSEVDDERAVDALSRFVMESEDDEVRERAVFALSQHDSPRAMETIRQVARDESMPTRLRSRAIFWLAEEGSSDDIETLKSMFAEMSNPQLQERILFAVGQTERPEDADWLLSVATDEAVSTELRSRAIFWAAESGASVEALGRLYDSIDDRQLKERIIFGLSESDEPGAIDRLIEIARTEEDTQLRTRAIFWLGNSNDPRAADVLLEILSEPGGGN